jgi:hypothetical protein
MEEIDKQGRNLSTTVWTQLDRKAGAITELTIYLGCFRCWCTINITSTYLLHRFH